MNPTAPTVARLFRCTVEQVKSQYARNAAQLRRMADKAAASGRKVNGYTAEQLAAHAARASERSE